MFNQFKNAVQAQFNRMAPHGLFITEAEKDEVWQTYLNSFPPGTNPIFRERTEHDCQCCKQFIRAVGNVVAVIEGKVTSIWDVTVPYPYQPVADALAALVKSKPIHNVFRHYERLVGTNFNHDTADNKILWSHFYVELPNKFVVSNSLTRNKILSDKRGDFDVFHRGMSELTVEALETVLELIGQNSLYRGEENKGVLEAYLSQKTLFDKQEDKVAHCWTCAINLSPGLLRLRNTAIGTLLIDLSEGMELENAVKKFEKSIMCPDNYKRAKSIVTKAMAELAKAKMEELGFMPSTHRRYATLADISVNDILFVDRSIRSKLLDGDVFDQIASKPAINLKSLEKVEEVPIDTFLTEVLPKARSLSVMMENRHSGNLVSLIAPEHADAKLMFKWPNGFSWSYTGNVTDSMRERVAALGGRVDGALRFTHSWNHPEVGRNASLMDLHVFMPGLKGHKDGSHDIYPSCRRVGWNRRNDYSSGGVQDVDYTDRAPEGYVPVENISFPDIKKMPEGEYTFKIHNWRLRQPTTSGGRAEIEFGGQIFKYEYPAPLANKQWITLAKVMLKNGEFTIEHKMKESTSSRKLWGIDTMQFHRVNVVMFSPNHWDGHAVGNKHFFFMLDGCANEETARGFYNEFLMQELNEHRKVMEIVGSKMHTDKAEEQLSGLGFSSTQRNSLFCKVEGAFSRIVKVVF